MTKRPLNEPRAWPSGTMSKFEGVPLRHASSVRRAGSEQKTRSGLTLQAVGGMGYNVLWSDLKEDGEIPSQEVFVKEDLFGNLRPLLAALHPAG